MTIQFWHWWVLGLALMVVETFLPGAFFLWMGVGALAAGALLWLLPDLNLFAQIGVWAAVALGSVLTWRRLRPAPRVTPGETPLNDRGATYTGRRFTLETPIVNGVGRVRIDDGQWRIAGPDLPAGAQVRVLAVEGATLQVEKAD